MNRRGEPAENLAAAFLEGQGLKVLERNYRCRFGEIDIVAASGAVLVFVEVRARRSAAFGGAAGSITAAKRRRLVVAARHYLARRRVAGALPAVQPVCPWVPIQRPAQTLSPRLTRAEPGRMCVYLVQVPSACSRITTLPQPELLAQPER